MKCSKCDGVGDYENPRYNQLASTQMYEQGIKSRKKCRVCQGVGYIIGNVQVDNWIKCTDRLPKNEGYYFTYPPKSSYESYYHRYGKLKGKFTKDDFNGYEHEYHATHWMPLPKPPIK